MHYFNEDCFTRAQENTLYLDVLFTTQLSQVVLMCIAQNDEIPKEVHEGDQIFVIVEGEGKAILNGNETSLSKNSVLVIPAGTGHTIKNTGAGDLKLFTIYTPPHHKPGTRHATRADEKDHE